MCPYRFSYNCSAILRMFTIHVRHALRLSVGTKFSYVVVYMLHIVNHWWWLHYPVSMLWHALHSVKCSYKFSGLHGSNFSDCSLGFDTLFWKQVTPPACWFQYTTLHDINTKKNMFMLPSMATVLSSRAAILVAQKMMLVLCARPSELLLVFWCPVF
jgi:hypothetical protein